MIKMGNSEDGTAPGQAVNTPLRHAHMTNHNITNNTYAAPVTIVSIKVPLFWSEQPGVWFSQLESQFTIKGITAAATVFIDHRPLSQALHGISAPWSTHQQQHLTFNFSIFLGRRTSSPIFCHGRKVLRYTRCNCNRM